MKAWPLQARWRAPVAVAVLGLLLGLIFANRSGDSQRYGKPTAALDFAYPELVSGKPKKLSEYKGQVVLVDFWATWCDPCLESIPDLIKLHKAYSAKGFTVLGVSTDALGKNVVGPFVKAHKMPYPILLSESEIPEGWPVPGYPTSFLLDKDGRVVKRYLGQAPYEELEADVKAQLAR